MKKERFADEEIKDLIRDINAGVLTIDEQTAIDVAIFDGVPVGEAESFTINEFGEIVREEKQPVAKVSLEELERMKKDKSGEIAPEM